MIEKLRKFFATRNGQIVAGALLLVGIFGAIYSFKSSMCSDAVESSRNRNFIDSTNGKAFSYTVGSSDRYPVKAPSGGMTGYPAEMCWWTKDGKARTEPYPVLLNEWVGKNGPTFCPDCGRLVVGHNPPARPGDKPPPTQAEYASRPRQSDR